MIQIATKKGLILLNEMKWFSNKLENDLFLIPLRFLSAWEAPALWLRVLVDIRHSSCCLDYHCCWTYALVVITLPNKLPNKLEDDFVTNTAAISEYERLQHLQLIIMVNNQLILCVLIARYTIQIERNDIWNESYIQTVAY